jgi:hypothetical protein
MSIFSAFIDRQAEAEKTDVRFHMLGINVDVDVLSPIGLTSTVSRPHALMTLSKKAGLGS